MKTIKVFAGNKRLKDIYPHATKWQVFKFKTARLIRKVFMIAMATAGVTIIVLLSTEYQVSQRLKITKEAPVVSAEDVNEIPPVMKRVAQCESGNKQYADNGQVITNGNKNGSVDIGRFQINLSIWGETATELGFDLTKDEDNTNFALYLYENYGTEPWVWSKKCWN